MTKNKRRFFIGVFLLSILGILYFAKQRYMRPPELSSSSLDGREEVSGSLITSDSKTMVALCLGQSNASNSCEARYSAQGLVYNYFGGKLYRSVDPILGADGRGGSVWNVLGDYIIEKGLYSKVILVPVGVSGTPISCWATGECHAKLVKTLEALETQHIKITHIFYHQGESDNHANTSRADYLEGLSTIRSTFRFYGQTAPLYVSIASYYPNTEDSRLNLDTAIQNAQRNFIEMNDSVYFGANTDTIIEDDDRYDGVHFSSSGNNRYALSWLNAIVERREK